MITLLALITLLLIIPLVCQDAITCYAMPAATPSLRSRTRAVDITLMLSLIRHGHYYFRHYA